MGGGNEGEAAGYPDRRGGLASGRRWVAVVPRLALYIVSNLQVKKIK